MVMSQCLDDEVLTRLVEDALSPQQRTALERHIDRCSQCRSLVSALARVDAPADGDSPDSERGERVLHPGDKLGRYELVDVVGLGSMGVVWSARDPELRRTVALKLLWGEDRADARARLLREARVLARLRHPNVLVIYDVGEHDGRVFLATELVAGSNLRTWLEEQRPTWRAIVDAFVLAGRGLEAAHAAGIVHRDFKPQNVLVEPEGTGQTPRVLVTDFGLARAMDGASTAPPEAESGPMSLDQTQAGSVVGTPAYMAPEVLATAPADDKADQFSFCVALWEALYGSRPHDADDLDGLYVQARKGPPKPPPEATCPVGLGEVLQRGLAPRPEQRFDSIAALLSALRAAATDRGSVARSRLVAGVVGLATIAGAAVAIAVVEDERPDPKSSCDAPSSVWTASRRDATKAAFESSGRPFADDVWHRVDRSMVEYESEWNTAFERTCLARTEDAQECLHRRHAAFDALAGVFAEADETTVLHATSLLTSLMPPQRCEDTSIATTRPPWPAAPELRQPVAKLRRQLARVRMLEGATKLTEASDALKPLIEAARETGYTPVVAEALALEAEIAREAGRAEDAIALNRDVLAMAESSGYDLLKVDAAVGLFTPLAAMGRLDEAKGFADLAEATLERIGGDDDYAARVAYFRGELAQRAGELDACLEHQRRALQLWQNTGSPNVGFGHHGLATALRLAGRANEALEHQQQAIAELDRVRGPHHPAAAQARAGLGLVLLELDRPEQAVTALELSVTRLADAFGANSPNLAQALTAYATALRQAGRLQEAAVQFERCVAVLSTGGTERPGVDACRSGAVEVRQALNEG